MLWDWDMKYYHRPWHFFARESSSCWGNGNWHVKVEDSRSLRMTPDMAELISLTMGSCWLGKAFEGHWITWSSFPRIFIAPTFYSFRLSIFAYNLLQPVCLSTLSCSFGNCLISKFRDVSLSFKLSTMHFEDIVQWHLKAQVWGITWEVWGLIRLVPYMMTQHCALLDQMIRISDAEPTLTANWNVAVQQDKVRNITTKLSFISLNISFGKSTMFCQHKKFDPSWVSTATLLFMQF